jgi:hypothetical protein
MDDKDFEAIYRECNPIKSFWEILQEAVTSNKQFDDHNSNIRRDEYGFRVINGPPVLMNRLLIGHDDAVNMLRQVLNIKENGKQKYPGASVEQVKIEPNNSVGEIIRTKDGKNTAQAIAINKDGRI